MFYNCFLKVLISTLLLTLIVAITQRINFKSCNDSDKYRTSHSSTVSSMAREIINVGVVACGQQAFIDAMVMIKSLILSSDHHRLEQPLKVILFVDNDALDSANDLMEKLSEFVEDTKNFEFRYEIHLVSYPEKNREEWKEMFKPCSTQRLFFPSLLHHINKLIYLDSDSIVLGNIAKFWELWGKMSSEQVVGLAYETEENITNNFYQVSNPPHPFYPPWGLNTGIMMMNLEKLRKEFPWEDTIMNIFHDYKGNLTFGDQAILNVMFYLRPDALYRLPCTFNFRADHCKEGWNCKSALENGIQVLHGNRGYFHLPIYPMFIKLYEYFQKFELSKDYWNDLVIRFRNETETIPLSDYNLYLEEDKINTYCNKIGQLIL